MARTTTRFRLGVLPALAMALAASTAGAAEVTLYSAGNFGGEQLTLRGWTKDISRTGFNDRASSVVVTSGRWELCSESDFKGYCAVFTRGEYPELDGRLNNRVSSARETGSYGDRQGNYSDYGRGAIELFDQPGFRGQTLRVEADTPSLGRNGFNDRAASVVVTQGSWELCSDAEFRGTCRTFAPGRYPDLGYGMERQVSSARLLRSAADAPAIVSQGMPPAPANGGGRAVLYSERGLRGASLAVSGPVGDLERSNFNDTAGSLYVESGTWIACRDSHFRGDCRSFGPGRYDDLAAAGLDRAISSIRQGGEVAAPPQPPAGTALPSAGIQFYSEPEFGGERVVVDRDMGDLSRLNFNDRVASAVVIGGVWEMCADARFGGGCAVYRPGRYPRLGGLTRQVSSVRRIQ